MVANREIDLETAEEMHKLFLEIIIAPSFSKEAFNVLSGKKNLRLMTLDFSDQASNQPEVVSVLGGLLVQDQDVVEENLQRKN